ncbi:hypothetical protein Tco_1176369 [Tanacetum coccineum]
MSTSSSTPAVSSDVAELKDMVRALILDRKNQTPASAPVKAVEESCVTCGGAHSYQSCPATDGNVYHDNIQASIKGIPVPDLQCQGPIYQPQVNQPPAYQAPVYQTPAPQTQSVSKTDFDSYVKANDAVMRNMQNQNQVLQNQGVTTRSGVTIQGPKAVNHDTEVTKDTMPPANNGSTENVQPPIIKFSPRNPIPEPNVAPVVTPLQSINSISSRRNDEGRKESYDPREIQ